MVYPQSQPGSRPASAEAAAAAEARRKVQRHPLRPVLLFLGALLLVGAGFCLLMFNLIAAGLLLLGALVSFGVAAVSAPSRSASGRDFWKNQERVD